MRHHRSVKKFGRKANQRRALLKSLARSLILKERIETSQIKAKALRPFVEKLVSRAKRKSLANQRLLVARVGREAARKLTEVLGPRFEKRPGGYLKISKLPSRQSDGSRPAILEFIKIDSSQPLK